MAIINDEVDAVVVGLGWTGSIMAMELARAGLKVRALERGGDQNSEDYAYPKPADQYAYDTRYKIFARPEQAAVTVRHKDGDTALPTRQWGSFCPGNGVGGAGLHWTGVHARPSETDLKLKDYADEFYAPGQLSEEMEVRNYPFDWEEIEPHLDFFDKVVGASGQTGNLRGEILPGGDPFEGPRSNPFPLPPMTDTLNCAMFRDVASKQGYHPFSNPSANASQAWTNPYNQQIAPVTTAASARNTPA
ncbi:hypothetical protein BVG79_p1000166 (plasmid) [Ketogulonicigenium robustum]|uniref:Uncharacterized protein n=1 Tax=Ketogulonicigenium robustum TaxID=92947 RepID=A0A1W6P384_9RHOB|nr:hypothetical protein BVG79_p1000166 [Ketogulonicigenium robustum]